MYDSITITPDIRPRVGRSIFAVFTALIGNAAASLAVDQLFHELGVYPSWGEPMFEPALNLLALSYRLVFGVASGYLVARLAPRAPMRHALMLGMIASVLAVIGVVGAIAQNLGPAWYPIALALSVYPTIRIGAELQQRRARSA